MPDENYPLLFFPNPTEASRNTLGGGASRIHVPGGQRQRERVAPQLAVLQQAFETKALRLQQGLPAENPELVLVLEIAGTVQDFARAVAKVPGLDWMFEWAEEDVNPDDDFYGEGRHHEHEPFEGRLFLLGSNQQALAQLLGLWNMHSEQPEAPFARGLAPFKHVFSQLRRIRHWDVSDRVPPDTRAYWEECVNANIAHVRFEVEAWHFTSAQKNEAARAEIYTRVQELGGQVLRVANLPEIAYHGFLVSLPREAIATILAGEVPDLLLSDRVMFFRPKAQAISDGVNEAATEELEPVQGETNKPAVVALLDGLPLANHALLAGRLVIDDPDDWEATYEAKDRVHGTAMASLIVHGDLQQGAQALDRKVYVRPILRPDITDNYNQRRREQTPDNELLIDLVHRATRRLFEGDGNAAPVAPTIRVINISVGDPARLFSREMSPWARLLDWLAYKYSILFIVSAGNDLSQLTLDTPANSLQGLTDVERSEKAFSSLVSDVVVRRLIAPAESVNALTVGAVHLDSSLHPIVPGRFDLFAAGGLSPISRIGHGYRRSVKPDVLFPGGRVLYRERFLAGALNSTVEVVTASAAPGQLVALPPLPGQPPTLTCYTRGTSNAAALASRAASRAFDVLEALRAATGAPEPGYDAVALKAMLVHGASWGDLPDKLLAERPEFSQIANGNARRAAEKDFVTRWLGYGIANPDRALACAAERATLLGFGEIGPDEGLVFSAPLPPGLAGKKTWRRVTVTLAWISPTNPAHQSYRRAKLWASPPQQELQVKRANSVHEKAALRGTVQHEVLEGEAAVAFADGDRFTCKVNCSSDAGKLEEKVRFAICVSLEVAAGVNINVYEEVRARIQPPVTINVAPAAA
jgi:hypothetical protein